MFECYGDSVAYVGSDGLKVFDLGTHKLVHAYVPPNHLSAACSCVAWKPAFCCSSSSQKKTKLRNRSEKKSTKGHVLEDVLAIGTGTGPLLIFSCKKGELLTKLEDAQCCSTQSVDWSVNDHVYSGSADGQVYEWDVHRKALNRKWLADESSICRLCSCPEGRLLLTGGRAIKCWDLKTRHCIRTFSGHASPIVALRFLIPRDFDHHCNSAGDDDSDLHELHFLSAAKSDVIISVWKLKRQDKKRVIKPTSFLALQMEPVSLSLSQLSSSDSKSICVTAVTSGGTLEIFYAQLNEKSRVPAKAKCICQVASNDSPSKPLQILTAAPLASNELIAFMYGCCIRPGFDALSIAELKPQVCLVREDPLRKLKDSNEESVSKVITPIATSGNADSLPPEILSKHLLPLSRKQKGEAYNQVPMEDRLKKVLGNETRSDELPASSMAPSSESLSTLLIQGLHSQDKNIINIVLQTTDQAVILSTVRQLPVNHVFPLLRELASRLRQEKDLRNYLLWLNCTLSTHMAFLSSQQDIAAELSTIYNFFEAKLVILSKVCRLQGRINLLIEQAEAKEKVFRFADQQPLCTFQEESSASEHGSENLAEEDQEMWNELEWSDDEAGERNQMTNGREESDTDLEEGKEANEDSNLSEMTDEVEEEEEGEDGDQREENGGKAHPESVDGRVFEEDRMDVG